QQAQCRRAGQVMLPSKTRGVLERIAGQGVIAPLVKDAHNSVLIEQKRVPALVIFSVQQKPAAGGFMAVINLTVGAQLQGRLRRARNRTAQGCTVVIDRGDRVPVIGNLVGLAEVIEAEAELGTNFHSLGGEGMSKKKEEKSASALSPEVPGFREDQSIPRGGRSESRGRLRHASRPRPPPILRLRRGRPRLSANSRASREPPPRTFGRSLRSSLLRIPPFPLPLLRF